MCTLSAPISYGICDVTASVFEIFFDASRWRDSMFRKSVLPPVLSW